MGIPMAAFVLFHSFLIIPGAKSLYNFDPRLKLQSAVHQPLFITMALQHPSAGSTVSFTNLLLNYIKMDKNRIVSKLN